MQDSDPSEPTKAVYYTAETVRNMSLPEGIIFLDERINTTDKTKNDWMKVG